MVLNRRAAAAQAQKTLTASSSPILSPSTSEDKEKSGQGYSDRSCILRSAAKSALLAASFFCLGLTQSTTFLHDNNDFIFNNSQNFARNTVLQNAINKEPQRILGNVDGDTTKIQMPITQSISRGFHPVYVYSQAIKTREPKKKFTYSQAKQDLLISALMDANDVKIRKSKEKGSEYMESNGVASQSSRKLRSKNAKTGNSRYFVDLAANHAIHFSNSYLLEVQGWDGLCLEPNPIYWYELAAYRKCTIVGAFVGGLQEEDGKEVKVHISKDQADGVFGGIVAEGMDNSDKTTEEKRNLVSILTVFQETNVPSLIDYFSLDVEGAETIVMNQFPWDTYKFKFITIERPKDDLKEMLIKNGYIQAMEITNWGETLWIHEESVALTKKEINDFVDTHGLRCRWRRGMCRD